ncbi:MAG: hypothetical protein MJD61_22360 [Proteobacteria bacterium]|nr:hypothetical protein [Pseudomonadota bacterium]
MPTSGVTTIRRGRPGQASSRIDADQRRLQPAQAGINSHLHEVTPDAVEALGDGTRGCTRTAAVRASHRPGSKAACLVDYLAHGDAW